MRGRAGSSKSGERQRSKHCDATTSGAAAVVHSSDGMCVCNLVQGREPEEGRDLRRRPYCTRLRKLVSGYNCCFRVVQSAEGVVRTVVRYLASHMPTMGIYPTAV